MLKNYLFSKGESDFPLASLICAAFGGGVIIVNIISIKMSYHTTHPDNITRCSFPCSPHLSCHLYFKVQEKIQLQKDSKGWLDHVLRILKCFQCFFQKVDINDIYGTYDTMGVMNDYSTVQDTNDYYGK